MDEEFARFLAERLNEDEARAKRHVKDWRKAEKDLGTPIDPGAYWNPVRVLAEVEAKRRILSLHSPNTLRGCIECCGLEWPCPTLLAVASVYQDHEAFREEWRV